MEQTISATDARVHFGEVMRHVVETNLPMIVERDGKPQVVLLSTQAYEQLRSGQQPSDWRQLVQQSRAQIQSELAGRALPPPEDLIRQLREERDEHLTDLR